MARNQWVRRLLAGTRGRILDELRRGPATVNELSERLELSANAVRSHLAALERDRLVIWDQRDRHGVGKPAHSYKLTQDANTLTPKAYDLMLDVVLAAARERAGPKGYAEILKDAAQRLAGEQSPKGKTFAARLADTKALLAGVGAEVEVERAGNVVRLRGTDCPLASMVGAHPELCGVLAAVIARRLGVPVKEHCDRAGILPRCCFEAAVERAA
jgi:predicted ArsR family transcriptional regulator